MAYNILKIVISAAIIVAVSELAKRSMLFGALVASLPLTSLLAFVWFYRETSDAARVAELSFQIFWLVIPSLALFLTFPWLVRRGIGFWPSLSVALLVTVLTYLVSIPLIKTLGASRRLTQPGATADRPHDGRPPG